MRSTTSSGSATGNNPLPSALLRKMSANSLLTTARKPKPSSAHGACSREEPQPKFFPATSSCARLRFRTIEHEVGPWSARRIVAPIREEIVAEPEAVGGLEKARGNDLIGVDVLERQHDGGRAQSDERLHDSTCLSRDVAVRASAIVPAIAVAAAVSGLARKVRPPFPCRPSKLRLLVLTAYCPGRSSSPFIAMHIEHPASRHSAPAARKIASSPSASAWRFTSCEPGHDEHAHRGCDALAAHHARRETQIGDPRVGARAEENDVDRLCRGASRQA